MIFEVIGRPFVRTIHLNYAIKTHQIYYNYEILAYYKIRKSIKEIEYIIFEIQIVFEKN